MTETEAIIRMSSYFSALRVLELIQTICIALIAIIALLTNGK